MRVGSFFKQEIKKTCNQALSLYFKLNLGIKLVISFKPLLLNLFDLFLPFTKQISAIHLPP